MAIENVGIAQMDLYPRFLELQPRFKNTVINLFFCNLVMLIQKFSPHLISNLSVSLLISVQWLFRWSQLRLTRISLSLISLSPSLSSSLFSQSNKPSHQLSLGDSSLFWTSLCLVTWIPKIWQRWDFSLQQEKSHLNCSFTSSKLRLYV